MVVIIEKISCLAF